MALREKLEERARPLLEPGERVEAVFLAQTGPNPNWLFLTWLVLFWVRHFAVAVTDRRVAVFTVGRWSATTPTELVASHSRDLPLAVASSGLWRSIVLDGTRYWVNRRFAADLGAIAAPAVIDG